MMYTESRTHNHTQLHLCATDGTANTTFPYSACMPCTEPHRYLRNGHEILPTHATQLHVGVCRSVDLRERPTRGRIRHQCIPDPFGAPNNSSHGCRPPSLQSAVIPPATQYQAHTHTHMQTHRHAHTHIDTESHKYEHRRLLYTIS